MFNRLVTPPDYRQQLENTFTVMLGESPACARRLARRWFASRRAASQMWHHCSSAPLDDIIAQAGDIHLPGEDALKDWLAQPGPGTVMLTIHMGDYLYALFRLLQQTERRHIVILRKKAESDAEQRCFARLEALGHTVQIIRHGTRAATQLIRQLRQGAVAILLFDLPARWGRTSPVLLFGQTLHWVTGPLQIAQLGNAKVVPFVCTKEDAATLCHLLTPYDYHNHPGEKRHSDGSRLYQQTETLIRQFPEQWHHWHLIPEMLNPDEVP